MEIVEITRYKFDGVEYQSLSRIKTEVENRIGRIIDLSDVTLSAKQKLNLLKAFVSSKSELSKMLNVTYEIQGERFGQDETKNILDL